MRLNYRVLDAGWAKVEISCDEAHIELTASYLHDSLRDLASAALALVNGAREVTVIFMDEPGEHHVVFRRADGENVDLDILWYSDYKSWGIGSGPAETRLSCHTRLAHVRGQVFSALKEILAEDGIDGYREKWEYEFPLKEYEALCEKAG